MILRPPRVNRTNPLFPDTTLFRSGRRARAHHRSHLLQADRRARAVAVPPGAQARRQTGVRLELRLPAPPRQIRQPLAAQALRLRPARSEEHTSELQSLMRISYAVFCLKKKKQQITHEYLYIH